LGPDLDEPDRPYGIVTRSVPVAQLLPWLREAVTFAVCPEAPNVAKPGVLVENNTAEVLSEVQVELAVTSLPFNAAAN